MFYISAGFILSAQSLTLPILFLLALVGCTHQPLPAPQLNEIFAVRNEQGIPYAYWLSQYQGQPSVLSEWSFNVTFGETRREYRWRDGQLREIEQKGNVAQDGKSQSRHFLVRYDSEGQAVYQKNRVNDEPRAMHLAELTRLYQEGQKQLIWVQNFADKPQIAIQGYWQTGQFIRCGEPNHWQAMSMPPALSPLLDLSKEKPIFVLAIEAKGRQVQELPEVVWAAANEQACLTRPQFVSIKSLN